MYDVTNLRAQLLADIDAADVVLLYRRTGWYWFNRTAARRVRKLGDPLPPVFGPFFSAVDAARDAIETTQDALVDSLVAALTDLRAPSPALPPDLVSH